MQPPKWLLVLGLGACVLSNTHQPNDSGLAASHDDVSVPAKADETLAKHDALHLSGDLHDLVVCDDYNCFCQHGRCYEKKGMSCDRDSSCEFKASFCPNYRNYPHGYSPPAHCKREEPAISDGSAGPLLEHGNTIDAQHHHATVKFRRAKGPVHDLLEDQCNAEASEAMEVILQNYLDDLVDKNSHKTSENVPCSQVVLYDIMGQDEDVGGRLSKLWHWSDESDPADHHGSQVPFRGNNVNAITVLTRKDPMLMNTTLAINPRHRMEKLADFDGETCVMSMLAAVVPADEQSKTRTLKVTLSSGGTDDHTETWSCAKSTSLQKTPFIMERDQGRTTKSDPFVQTIPLHATIGQTFSVDTSTLSSMRLAIHGPLTVIATSPPAYSGSITLHLKDNAFLTVGVQASTNYHLTPPAVVVTKSALGTRGSYTVPLPSTTPVVPDQLTHAQSMLFRTAIYDESEALHALKKKECGDRMLLHPASKGQKCKMTVDFFGEGIKATLTATATNPPGWSARVKDKHKHRGTLEYQFLTDHTPPMILITANRDDAHTTLTVGRRGITAPIEGANAAATPLADKISQRNRLYAGLPNPATRGETFTTTVNLDGREVAVSGSITAISPTGFVMTIDNDTAAATLYAELDEAHDPIMVRGSIFSDGMAATINEPWPPGGFTGVVNPDILDVPNPRHTGTHVQGRQVFTPATTSTTTLPESTVSTASSSSSHMITATRTTTVTVLTGSTPASVMTQPPVTLTNTVMSLGDKIIPITGSSRQIVNNTIMTMVYPPRANLNIAACDRNRLIALEDALGSDVTSPEFTNLTIYRALHPEYNWDAVKHYADQLKPETTGAYATQLAILCMRNGDQKFTSASCPCDAKITTTINGNVLVLPAPTTTVPFPHSGARSTVTVVQIGSTVLPYNASTTYPPGAQTEVVFATPASSQAAGVLPTFTLPQSIVTTTPSSLGFATVYVVDGHTFSLSQSPGAVLSTTINSTPLVFTVPPAISFTPSGTRTETTVVQVDSTMLPYNASTTYPPGAMLEIIRATKIHYSTARGTNLPAVPTPTAAPICSNSKRGCRINKCLWDHQKPINISTVMPALMDDPYDGHMMYDYFTQRTSLTGRPHWGTTADSGLYYPTHLETHAVSGIYAVRDTPTPIARKRSLINSEPVVHPAPDCFDANSCYDVCKKKVDRHSKIKLIGASVGGTLVGAILLTAGLGMLITCCKRRRRATPNPASQATTPMQTVDPVTGQPIIPVVGNDSLGRTTAVDPTTGAAGTKPALRSAGTLGRQAEEGRGHVHFGEDQPGGAAEGATSAGSGPGNGMGSGTGAGGMTGTAADAASSGATSAADATRAATDAVPAGTAAAAKTVAQPAAATSQVAEKTVPDASAKMAHVPEEAAEHVEAVPAHDGADSRRTGSEVVDMGSIRGRRRMRPNGRAFD